MKKIILLLCLFAFAHAVYSQTVGIRAGINFSSFSGPLENGESFGYNNGIHFGISYGYKFTPRIMLRAEMLYSQKGTKQKYEGESYFLIYTPKKTVYENGYDTFNLQISNAYISLPLVVAFQASKKFEIYGGLSPSILINPTARGTRDFISRDHPDDILFRQSLVYNYSSDVPKGSSSASKNIRVRVNGEIIGINKIANAYYQTDFVPETYINAIDLSGVVGFNYFFNRGFFGGLRLEYGLMDVTSNKVDYSRAALNLDKTLILREDFDRNVDISLSLGFRF